MDKETGQERAKAERDDTKQKTTRKRRIQFRCGFPPVKRKEQDGLYTDRKPVRQSLADSEQQEPTKKPFPAEHVKTENALVEDKPAPVDAAADVASSGRQTNPGDRAGLRQQVTDVVALSILCRGYDQQDRQEQQESDEREQHPLFQFARRHAELGDITPQTEEDKAKRYPEKKGIIDEVILHKTHAGEVVLPVQKPGDHKPQRQRSPSRHAITGLDSGLVCQSCPRRSASTPRLNW